MLTPLRTPVDDARATDLCLELDLSAPDARPEARLDLPLSADALLPLDLGDVRLELRIRGTSHQAVLGCERGLCAEVVTSRPYDAVGLPGQEMRDLAGLQYRFGAEVLTLAAKEFSAQARALRAELGRDRNGLVGSCADDPEALTAVRARRRDREIRWQTWRAYPRTREIVVTRTSVRVA